MFIRGKWFQSSLYIVGGETNGLLYLLKFRFNIITVDMSRFKTRIIISIVN